MPLPARRVAVVGAGISGVCAAAHLLKFGVDVVVFERGSVAGGVWHLDDRVAPDPAYPNVDPGLGDYVVKPEGLDPGDEVDLAPPGACYYGLRNNVETRLMQSSLARWPEGTPDFVSQNLMDEYIQGVSKNHGVDGVTRYGTRVDKAVFDEEKEEWQVQTARIESDAQSFRRCIEHWTFDSVVVASGHYNAPKVPDFPGLKLLKSMYPNRVQHSKSYRKPDPFAGKNILLIGAGVSSWDIARETTRKGTTVYQSSRAGQFDIPARLLPDRTIRVGEVICLEVANNPKTESELAADDPIPVRITLARSPSDGGGEPIILENVIHHIILCTGYMISYPYLPQIHRGRSETATSSCESSSEDSSTDTSSSEEKNEDHLAPVVNEEGTVISPLYMHTFALNNPSLAFVGSIYHTATFSLFDFQAQMVARVLAGFAKIPPQSVMVDWCEKLAQKQGLTRNLRSLKADGEEIRFVNEVVDWMNDEWRKLGPGTPIARMVGHTPAWIERYGVRKGIVRRILTEGTLEDFEAFFAT